LTVQAYCGNGTEFFVSCPETGDILHTCLHSQHNSARSCDLQRPILHLRSRRRIVTRLTQGAVTSLRDIYNDMPGPPSRLGTYGPSGPLPTRRIASPPNSLPRRGELLKLWAPDHSTNSHPKLLSLARASRSLKRKGERKAGLHQPAHDPPRARTR
jgi:hypothetical protein